MSKIALVTDSTAYIPKDLVEKYKLNVAPQVVIWGDKTYEDGVDIQPIEFYERLSKASVMPSTSQATIASFEKIYRRLLEEDYEILTIVISDKLSGTMNSAIQAREMFSNAPIEIVDSRAVAMALGFQVLSVAKARDEGANMAELVQIAQKASNHTGVIFAVDTLEFLHRGGRIGGGKRFLGTALKIKPLLELRDGSIEALEQVRTRKKSMQRLVELLEERTAGKSPVRLATLHANAYDDARELLSMATERIQSVESVFSEVSPAVGTHAGPGTVGLAFMAGM
ncbi:MAG: DegV family protein [Anaerolineales bacterium]|nr:MAG: DegV family protein [Anaerolineales bacterium]